MKIRQFLENFYTEFHENPIIALVFKTSTGYHVGFPYSVHVYLVKTHKTKHKMWSTPSYSQVLMQAAARRCPLQKFSPITVTPGGKSEQKA